VELTQLIEELNKLDREKLETIYYYLGELLQLEKEIVD